MKTSPDVESLDVELGYTLIKKKSNMQYPDRTIKESLTLDVTYTNLKLKSQP